MKYQSLPQKNNALQFRAVSDTSNRKKEHLEFATGNYSQAEVSPGWEDVHLVPASIPRVAPTQAHLESTLGGHQLDAPFAIASMTGGHPDAEPINQNLAIAAEELGIAIGSGSQRAVLRNSRLAKTYRVIRESAPTAVVMANIGICQLVDQGDALAFTRDEIETAVGMLDAQFLIVHLNLVEEMVQPEGDRNLTGLADALVRTVEWSPVPVIAKETGSGMSRRTCEALVAAGASILDVGGAGGTSFARIEGKRAEAHGDTLRARIGNTFSDWGLPTASSLIEARNSGVPVIATGGIRNGLDAAKAIALGAAAVGVGRPALSAALKGPQEVIDEMTAFIQELRMAVSLTGNEDLQGLRTTRIHVTGRTREFTEENPHT